MRLLGDSGHTLGACHIAYSPHEVGRVVLFERSFQILDDYLVIGEKICTVPGCIFFLGHVITLDFTRHLPSASYISLLARLVATAEQNNHSLSSNSAVDAIALTDINAEFADASADRPMVAEIALFNPVDSDYDLRLRSPVAQSSKPMQEAVTLYYIVVHSAILYPKGYRMANSFLNQF